MIECLKDEGVELKQILVRIVEPRTRRQSQNGRRALNLNSSELDWPRAQESDVPRGRGQQAIKAIQGERCTPSPGVSKLTRQRV